MVWQFLKKLKIELPYDPTIPLLGLWPEELKAGTWTAICTPMLIAALFTIWLLFNSQKVEVTHVSIDKWMDKQNVVHMQQSIIQP